MFVLLHFHLEIHCSQSLALSKMKFSTTVCTCACPCVGRWVWAGHTGAKTKIEPSQPKSNEPICKPICLKTFWIKKHFIEHFVVQNIPRNFFPGKQIFVAFTGHFFVQKLSLEVVSCKKNIFYNPGGPLSEIPSPPNPRAQVSNIPTKPASTHIPDPLTFYTKLPIQTQPTKTLPPSTKAQSRKPTKPWDTNQKLNLNPNHQPKPKTTTRRRQNNKTHKKKQKLTT